MKRTNSQSERQSYIDLQVRAGKYPSVYQLAADMEVSEKTIKRDIEFMRDRLCVPIAYDRKRRGYYYSEATWGIPAFIVTQEERRVAELAKTALAQSADYELVLVLEQFFHRLFEGAIRPECF